MHAIGTGSEGDVDAVVHQQSGAPVARDPAEITCGCEQGTAAGAPVTQLDRIDTGRERAFDAVAPALEVANLHDQKKARRPYHRRVPRHSMSPPSGLEAVA